MFLVATLKMHVLWCGGRLDANQYTYIFRSSAGEFLRNF